MSLSRRSFFRRLARPGARSPEERRERYRLMDDYVRTCLFPAERTLTDAQQAELLAYVQQELEETSDEELFSAIIHFKVDEAVYRKMRRWSEEPS
jgi:hypothetical protein